MRRILLPALLGVLGTTANASAWIEPDDLALRHDIQLLSDYGLLPIPTSSWPLRWSNVRQSLTPLAADAGPMVQEAHRRLRRALDAYALRQGRVSATLATTVGSGRMLLQGFGPTQRSESSAAVAIAADAGPFEGRLAYSAATPSAPEFHAFDHSYLGGNLGNWNVGVDLLERWWGPGWDGSLILSNNPHPLPTLSLQRNHTAPFDSKWLHWLGPWDLNLRFGQFEQARTVPRGQFFAARLVFQPLSGLEVGLSRAAQWGGEGRSNDLDAFLNMLLGQDNGPSDGHTADEPGNQLGGYDVRWSVTPARLALYGQLIGEDESVMLPTAKMLLAGVEHWGMIREQSFRLFFEYADTATYRGLDFGGAPGYNTAYNHHLFKDGYRYYGDALGHSADNDTIVRSLGLVTTNSRGWSSQFIVRRGTINRDDAGQNLVSNGEKMELREWSIRIGKRRDAIEGFVQFGNSRRESASGEADESVVSTGVEVSL